MNEPLIDESSREALTEKFRRELQDEVSLSIFVGPDNREHCDFTVQLCEELHGLDSRIKPTVYQNGEEKAIDLGITRTPADGLLPREQLVGQSLHTLVTFLDTDADALADAIRRVIDHDETRAFPNVRVRFVVADRGAGNLNEFQVRILHL